LYNQLKVVQNHFKVLQDYLAKIISSRCTISKADYHVVICTLSDVIGEALSDGKIVKIQNLGSFQLCLLSIASKDGTSLGKVNIKSARVVYRSSKDLKTKIKGITYKRIR